jgi:hypothetical protein
MTRYIGASGRRARDLALGRVSRQLAPHATGRLLVPVRSGLLPLVQRAGSGPSTESGAAEDGDLSPPASDQTPTAVQRETRSPPPEEVADRVYDLFRQDIRWGRERERPVES